jgi:hypothetical protein
MINIQNSNFPKTNMNNITNNSHAKYTQSFNGKPYKTSFTSNNNKYATNYLKEFYSPIKSGINTLSDLLNSNAIYRLMTSKKVKFPQKLSMLLKNERI